MCALGQVQGLSHPREHDPRVAMELVEQSVEHVQCPLGGRSVENGGTESLVIRSDRIQDADAREVLVEVLLGPGPRELHRLATSVPHLVHGGLFGSTACRVDNHETTQLHHRPALKIVLSGRVAIDKRMDGTAGAVVRGLGRGDLAISRYDVLQVLHCAREVVAAAHELQCHVDACAEAIRVHSPLLTAAVLVLRCAGGSAGPSRSRWDDHFPSTPPSRLTVLVGVPGQL